MKKILYAVLTLFFSFTCGAQELTAYEVAINAAKKSTQDAEQYVKEELKKITVLSEQRALYSFLGTLQELLSRYPEASSSYAEAAGIAAGNSEKMPKKSSEMLILDAARCALSAGDHSLAMKYLNSSVKNTKNETVQLQIKLYEQWAHLCRSEKIEDTKEAVSTLASYTDNPSMQQIKPSVLLTLWYLTGKKEYNSILNKEFPDSPETNIVNGKVQIMPAPFWYFVPRAAASKPVLEEYCHSGKIESDSEKTIAGNDKEPTSTEKDAVKIVDKNSTAKVYTPKETKEVKNTASNENTKNVPVKIVSSQKKSVQSVQTKERIKKQQLGLFREKENAQIFINKLKQKKFNAYLQEEKRSNGAVYFLVVVDENKEETIADSLRTAGFECYPLF